MGDSLVVAYSNFYFNYNYSDTTHIAIWNGTFFSDLQLLITNSFYDSTVVHSMIIYNGELYVVAHFDTVNGMVNTRSVVKWNGTQWESVGGGAGSIDMQEFHCLKCTIMNCMPRRFTDMGGSGANNFARWNGTTWNAVPFSNVDAWSVTDMKAWGSSLFFDRLFFKREWSDGTRNCAMGRNLVEFGERKHGYSTIWLCIRHL